MPPHQSQQPPTNLSHMADDDLLRYRICDLPLQLEGTPVSRQIKQLQSELVHAGLGHLRPDIYLGDEWFSPDGVSAIAVPFWLAHPRLKKLEKQRMRRVEGGTASWCMRLLRHEAGHCFDHAYGLSSRKGWQKIFGDPNKPYDVERYRADPSSRDYVINLEDHYAQSHPEEDFAETFAILLDPDSRWRQAYRNWEGAYEKLLFVEKLVKIYGPRIPKIPRGRRIFQASRMTRTLARYYENRRDSTPR